MEELFDLCSSFVIGWFEILWSGIENKLFVIQKKNTIFAFKKTNEKEMKPLLIVSFTSYPARIHAVPQVLESLYAQSMQPDRILLWLAEEQFPNHESDLPKELIDDAAAGKFELRWCDNLGSHKKYFYAMQEYPEDIIVTVDDDTFYHQDTLKTLMDTHARFPHAVVARTTSLVLLNSDLDPLPMNEWLFDFQSLTEPSMLLMSIGVGGVLYPPHSVSKKIFDKEFILETCTVNGQTFGDDLLLKVGEMLNNTTVVSVKSEPYLRLPNTQETALAKLMPNENHKDLLIKKYKERFQDFFDRDSVQRLRSAISDFEEKDNKLGLRKNYWLTRPSRDLERQLGYLSLPDAPSKPDSSDYKRIKEIARFAAKVFTAYPSDTSDDETAKAIHAFRQQLLNVPGIENLVEADIITCGLINYSVPLNTNCHILYHGIPIYMRSLKNWQSFMANHPNCKPIFREGYKTFLSKTEVKIGQAESVLSKTEVDEWKLSYEEAIKENTIIHKVPLLGFMKLCQKNEQEKFLRNSFNMKTIRTLIAKIPLAKPLYHAIKKRREELRRRSAQKQLRKKQPIIRQGSSECFDGLPLKVIWLLTSNCNIRCSYCFNVTIGYKKDFCTLEQAETAIKYLASANRPSYSVELLGGEPTTHPHLAEIVTLLCQHIGNRLEKLQITTNGLFSESQVETILKAGEQVNVKLAISIHLEYMSINKAVELVKSFSNRTYLEMRVMFQPDLFEKTVAMTDTLCSLRKDYSFGMEMGLLREGWPTFDKFDHRYTQEHFEWAEKTKKRFDEVALEGVKWAKSYPKTMGEEFLVERNMGGVVERYEGISQSELKKLTGNVFTGMTCCAGTNIIRIETNGKVKGMICVLNRLSGNIFEENPFLREDWIHGVLCTKAMCGCQDNYRIPKFKSPVEAQKFIDEKKRLQKKLMGIN